MALNYRLKVSTLNNKIFLQRFALGRLKLFSWQRSNKSIYRKFKFYLTFNSKVDQHGIIRRNVFLYPLRCWCIMNCDMSSKKFPAVKTLTEITNYLVMTMYAFLSYILKIALNSIENLRVLWHFFAIKFLVSPFWMIFFDDLNEQFLN